MVLDVDEDVVARSCGKELLVGMVSLVVSQMLPSDDEWIAKAASFREH